MHYDTVDNFHVVVGDASKSFDVISPGDLPQMYVDFPMQEEEDPTVRCPTRTTFGCDQFGCFGYVPFSASSIDLKEFPQVASATVLSATLNRGDVLVLPAYHLHRVKHEPLNTVGYASRGRNLAVAFYRRQPEPTSLRPWAHEIADKWQRRYERATAARTARAQKEEL